MAPPQAAVTVDDHGVRSASPSDRVGNGCGSSGSPSTRCRWGASRASAACASPVTTIVGQLAAGRTHAQILADFPELEEADIYAALEFAAEAVQEREVPLVG